MVARADRLQEYKTKRDFSRTREPEGKAVKSGRKLRYLIQKHAASRLHYDFRLEWNGTLMSWAIPKGPSENPTDKRLAEESWFQFGKVSYDGGKPDQAIAEFEKFLIQYPTSNHATEVKELLAQAYVNGNNFLLFKTSHATCLM